MTPSPPTKASGWFRRGGRALGLEMENTPDRDPEVELATGLTNQGFELENFAEESNGQSTSSATDRARAQRLDLTE